LHDSEEEALPLPKGEFDIPLGLAAKRYNTDGSLWDPEANGETTSVFGDVIHVNGQPWPYLNVTARKYRFRLLDSSISRSFQLYLEADKQAGIRIPFTVIGSDAGLLEKPVNTTQLDISMAERWEIVVDFTEFQGQNLTLRSNAKVGADTPYLHTDKVMRRWLRSITCNVLTLCCRFRHCSWCRGRGSRFVTDQIADRTISTSKDFS
jgi:bilirubin oxidase